MNHTVLIGFLLWAIIFYPVWSPRCRRIRAAQRRAEQVQARARVSRNQSGPSWEQDAPYEELFEQEDDL